MVEVKDRPVQTIDAPELDVDEQSAFAALASAKMLDAAMAGRQENFLQFARRSFLELTNIKFALASFVVNNLRRRYRRSVLGFAWSLLNPLLSMVVMTAVFSMLFRQHPRDFGVYVFTGLLPWAFIFDSVNAGGAAIVQAEPYLKKVYIPKMFFPLVSVATEGANFIFSLASLVFLAVCLGVQIKLSALLALPAVALLAVFCYGLGLFCSIATVYFRDLTHLLRVAMSTIFYTVPLIYPLSMVPQQYQWLYEFHPINAFVKLFRLTIQQGQVPSLTDWILPVVSTLFVMTLALAVLKRTEKDIIFRL